MHMEKEVELAEYASALSQVDYLQNMLEELPEKYKSVKVCYTVGQTEAPPDLDDVEKAECEPEVRTLIGVLQFAQRCTRLDLARELGLLGRFADRWCPWAERELKHILGYVKGSVKYELMFINMGDLWEDLYA